MTIQELLSIPSLQGMRLIAGHSGVHRRISTVTVIDTPDGAIWIKGNEFVITTAYAVRDDTKQLLDMIDQLAASRASGLGIKTGRFIKRIPKEALALANRLDFPLVSIPEEYAFCDVINPALSLIVNRQSVQLMQSAKIHQYFLEIAIENNDVPKILQTLSSLVGLESAFVDNHFRQIYFSNPDSALAKRISRTAEDGWFTGAAPSGEVHSVENRNEKFGHLILAEGDSIMDENATHTAIEYATIVLILWMQTRISNQHIEEKYRDAFLEDLLLNNVKTEDEIHNRASLYGWSFHHGGLVAVIDINNIKKYYLSGLDQHTNERLENSVQNIFDASIHNMLAQFPDARYYKQSDLIVFIISDKNRNQEQLNQQLQAVFSQIQEKIFRKVPFTVTMGVGEYMPNIRDIHNSYSQARMCIDLSYQLERFDCAIFYSQLGIYRLFSNVINTPECNEFCDSYINPLLDFDNRTRGNYFDTLQVIVQCGWNLKQASEKLFIHYNSTKYRFSRICEILRLDLHKHDNQLAVELAVKLVMAAGGSGSLPAGRQRR